MPSPTGAHEPHQFPQAGPGWGSRHQSLLLIAFVLLGFVISAGWLVFPYLVKDQNLLGTVGGEVKQAKLIKSISIGKHLSRTSFGRGEAQVDVLYATPKYFSITDRASVVDEYRPDQYLVFFVTETTHIEDLPKRLPEATLLVDGKVLRSADVEGPNSVFHHRVVAVRFAAFDESGNPVIGPSTDSIKLSLSSDWDPGGGSREFEWQLPIEYPAELQDTTIWTPLMVLGLSSGLLSFVLTPCLLQLLVVYMMTFTGLSAQQLQSGDGQASSAQRSRYMFKVSIAFVAGFAGLFMLTGALIGYAGKEMQMFFAEWSSKLSIMAGILVILMGLWIGIRARAPIICKIVPESFLRTPTTARGAYINSAATAVGFSLGCLTCFGGAIIATLLIYVGALGSAFIGAAVMLAFSMGVAIPFLLAAFFLSRMAPLLTQAEQLAPKIGFVSMLVIVAFGLVLVTDNFHVLSDFIYPYLGLI